MCRDSHRKPCHSAAHHDVANAQKKAKIILQLFVVVAVVLAVVLAVAGVVAVIVVVEVVAGVIATVAAVVLESLSELQRIAYGSLPSALFGFDLFFLIIIAVITALSNSEWKCSATTLRNRDNSSSNSSNSFVWL